MIVAFPIEISVREYLSKLFCVYQILNNTDYRVALGQKSEIYNFYKNNEGIYLISKGGSIKPFQLKKDLPRNKLSILDEEGPLINFSYTSDLTARTNKDIMKKLSDYYCWGKSDFDLIKTKISKNKIIISGHPKYDLCSYKYKKFFNLKKNYLKKKYGNFVLIASSFACVDGYIENEKYKKWWLGSVEDQLRNKKLKDLNNYFKFDQIYYENLVNFTKNIAEQNPNINFIFRPHPRQDELKVKKRFEKFKYKNIFVIKEDIITPYIYASSLYVHSGCTTALEAAILKKKIIYLVNKFKNSEILYKKFGITLKFDDFKKMNDILSNKLKYPFDKDNIQKFIFNYRGNSFYKVLIKRLKFLNLRSQKKLVKSFEEKNILLSKVKKIISNFSLLLNFISYFKPDVLFNKEYKKSKFQKMNIQQLTKDIKKFQNLDKSYFKFKVSKLNKNSFIFKKVID